MAGRSPTLTGPRLVGLGLALLMAGLVPPVAGAPAAPPGGHAPRTAELPFAAHRPPALPGPGLLGRLRPMASGSYYVQEGATINALNGSAGGSRELAEQVVLPDTQHTTGYELNGATDTHDWFQVLIAENWCGPDYAEIVAQVNSQNQFGLLQCLNGGSFQKGDTVNLALNITNGTFVCLIADDLTQSESFTYCTAQNDTGATRFVTNTGSGDARGFFTGSMTETIESNSSCPKYSNFPTTIYRWSDPTGVTAFTPWSDSFLLGGSGAGCYGQGSTSFALAPNDPVSYGGDESAGTGYGDRYVYGQNATLLAPGYDWEVETDARPLSAGTATSNRSSAPGGVPVALAISGISGGRAPYSALWFLNGTPTTERTVAWNFTTAASGTYRFTAYVVDADRTVIAAPPVLSVAVRGALEAGTIHFAPSARVDAGQSVNLSVDPGGGVPPYTVAWSGIPLGCNRTTGASVACRPALTGSYPISATVVDANGTIVATSKFTLAVDPALMGAFTVFPGSLEAGVTGWINATASGGRGPYTYDWTSLPRGCTGTGQASVLCDPSAAGNDTIGLWIGDANGQEVNVSNGTTTIAATLTASIATSDAAPESGATVTLSVEVVGGVAPFRAAWQGVPSGCPIDASLSLHCTVPGSGRYSVSVIVTDALGVGTSSNGVAISIQPGPRVTWPGGIPHGSVGSALDLSIVASGGSSGYRYGWPVVPPGCANSSVGAGAPQLTCGALTLAGTFPVEVVVVDASGGVGVGFANVTVDASSGSPAPSAALGELEGAALAGGILTAAVGLALVVRARRRADAP